MVMSSIDAVPSRKPRIAVVLDEDLFKYLQEWADAEERSLSNLAAFILKQAADGRKAEQASK